MPRLAPILLGQEYDTGDWRYFAVALATLFFSNLNDLPFTLFRLEHRPWIFTSYTIGRIFVQVPLSIVFVAVFDWGPMGVLLANLFTAAGMQVGLLPTYIRKVDWRWHWQLMKPMLAFAVPALFTGISFYWLKLSDRYFLLHYQGKAVVGLYTVAYSLSQPLYLTLMAFRMAWPQWHYAKLHEPEKHRRMVARSSTYFLALNAVMLVLMGAFMPFIVHTFLNERFWSIGPTTFVLALSVAVYAVYFVFWVGSNVAKKNRMIPVFFLIASAVNIGLNFLLVPEYGMYAAAWTTVAGFAILAATVYFYSREVVPDPLRVGPAAQDRAGDRPDADRRLGRRLGARAGRVHAVRPARADHAGPGADAAGLPARAVRGPVLHRRREEEDQPAGWAGVATAGPQCPAVAAAGPLAPSGASEDSVDRTRQLDQDDVEAEEEELEMENEADVDFIEGPSTTTIT